VDFSKGLVSIADIRGPRMTYRLTDAYEMAKYEHMFAPLNRDKLLARYRASFALCDSSEYIRADDVAYQSVCRSFMTSARRRLTMCPMRDSISAQYDDGLSKP
jgi:hypothetical protein